MKKKVLGFAGLLALMFCLISGSAFADTVGGGKVNASLLNMRSTPGMTGQILEVLPRDGFLLLEKTEGQWYKALHNGKEGYVASAYVSRYTTLDGVYEYPATVKGSSVRMRAMPSTSSSVLGYFNPGDKLNVVGVSGNWLKMAAPNGRVGYIRSDLVKYSGPVAQADENKDDADSQEDATANSALPHNADIGQQIVDTAMQYLGCPYQWGGMSPAGFDCSGFVNYVYNQHGYTLERVAQNIYNSSGVSVSRDQLQPGDILCFGYSANSVDHVGLYIGDGQFIHASTYNTGVIISNLSSTAYTNRYVGAKRLV